MAHSKIESFLHPLTRLLAETTGLRLSSRQAQHQDALFSFAFWFSDLGFREGPIFTLKVQGLHRHYIQLEFGASAEPIIRQIRGEVSPQRIETAKRLIEAVESAGFEIESNLFNLNSICCDSIVLVASKNRISRHLSLRSLQETIQGPFASVVLAAAELIGYEEDFEKNQLDIQSELEGSVSVVTIKRRERSKKNRQLCLSHNGHKCAVCGLIPTERYGDAGRIIEVHHIQPLSSLKREKEFDPIRDLVPLCPNCHRAVHTKKPVPWTLDELRKSLET